MNKNNNKIKKMKNNKYQIKILMKKIQVKTNKINKS